MTEGYEPTWESLSRYRVPRWFMDAKLGVFVHWGVYAVPAFGNEWYPRNMYRRGSPEYAHHLATWGEHRRFGYKDFIPLFRAERWDPTTWVALFREAGARYVVPVAEHHDGFPMYASPFTAWNAANMGPQRDVVAVLEHAIRAAGLKFGVSTHRAFNWRYYTFDEDYDTVDPGNIGLYGSPHPEEEPASPAFLADWNARTRDLIDRFQPDVLYFDFGWHQPEFDAYRPQIVAYFYNRALKWGREVVLEYKDRIPDGVAVYDVERGKLDDIRPHYWQTDTSISARSWGYVEDDTYKGVCTLVHDLVDVVSKNGNLLLNVGPRADGTIPEAAEERLRGLGRWLRTHGEAIYGTRAWVRYGEGPTKSAVGHLTEAQNEPYTARDIRFTQCENLLYAIALGQPGAIFTITSLGLGSEIHPDQIARIGLVGGAEDLTWAQDSHGLHVALPDRRPADEAIAVRITLRDLANSGRRVPDISY